MDLKEINELDSHWKEVIDLAVKYGFICQAYGDTAVLATHENQIEAVGEEKYLKFRDALK